LYLCAGNGVLGALTLGAVDRFTVSH